jgi:hypothetical protein
VGRPCSIHVRMRNACKNLDREPETDHLGVQMKGCLLTQIIKK